MFKYLKRAYIMSLTNKITTAPGGHVKGLPTLDINNNGTKIDELYKELAQTIKKENNPNKANELREISQKMQKERERISKLPEAEKNRIMEITKQATLEYSNDLARFAKSNKANRKQKEMMAKSLSEVKKFSKKMLTKAEQFQTFINNNPDAVKKNIKLKIEDNKLVIYENGDKKRFASIPRMKSDGTIMHSENLALLNNFSNEGMAWVKKRAGVKTFAEIGQENIQKQKQQEKMAALTKTVGETNKNVIKVTEKSIDWLKNHTKLPKGTKIVLNNNKVELEYNGVTEGYFSLNLQKTNGEFSHPENNGKNVYGNLKKWVENVLQRKKIIPKNNKLDIV